MQALREYLGQEVSEGLQAAYVEVISTADHIVNCRRLGQPLPNEADLLLKAMEPLEREHSFMDWEDSHGD